MWIRQVGLPVANEEAQVADSLSQAQVNKAYYEAGFLTVSKVSHWVKGQISWLYQCCHLEIVM